MHDEIRTIKKESYKLAKKKIFFIQSIRYIMYSKFNCKKS